MSKLINWYLVELRLRLDRSLPSERVDGIVQEAEAHLTESARNRLGPGIPEVGATEAAIAAYGDAGKVAKGYLKGTKQKLLGVSPVWCALFGSLVAICGWNFHWLTLGGYFDNFGDTWKNGLALSVMACGIVAILIASRTGLRSYRLPLTLFTFAAAGLSVPLMSWWMIPSPGDFHPGVSYEEGVSRFHLDRDAPMLAKTATTLVGYKSFVERGIREYAGSETDASLSSDLRDSSLAAKEFGVDRYSPAVIGTRVEHGGNYVVPREYGVFTTIDGGVSLLETVAFYDVAKTEWANYGPTDLDQLVREQRTLQGLIDNVNAAKSGRLFFFEPALYMQTVIGTVILLPAFLLFDVIGAYIGRPRRRSLSEALA